MSNVNKLSSYLKCIFKKKHTNGLKTFNKMKKGTCSYGHLSSVISGYNKSPSPMILRQLSIAIEEPYIDLLIAAGYLESEDLLPKKQDIINFLNKNEVPDEVTDKLVELHIQEQKEILRLLSKDDKAEYIRNMNRFTKGFLSD